MIYDQKEFHNVEEIITTDRGCRLSRLPLSVARQMNEGIPNSRAYLGTGVELRFRMPKREVTLHLRADANEEAQTALSNEAYEKRIQEFLELFKEDGRPVFVTDVYTKNGGDRERAEIFREIVRRNTEDSRLIYTPGKELLSQPEYISADMTHPTLEGQLMVAQRWSEVMRCAYDG